MWKVSEPVVGGWIARNLGPIGRLETAATALGNLAALAPRLPRLFDAVELIAARAATADGRRRRRFTALPLWVGALALVVIAASSLGWI
jgi:ubiquinone biosynthesis protein